MMLTLHDPQKTREHYASGAWQHDTMFGLLAKHTAQRPSAVALRDNFTTLTWLEVFHAVEVLAATLHHAGLKAGDRVAIWLPSRVESVMILLACSRNGYVCCPSLHQSYTADEIITLLNRVDCKPSPWVKFTFRKFANASFCSARAILDERPIILSSWPSTVNCRGSMRLSEPYFFSLV